MFPSNMWASAQVGVLPGPGSWRSPVEVEVAVVTARLLRDPLPHPPTRREYAGFLLATARSPRGNFNSKFPFF